MVLFSGLLYERHTVPPYLICKARPPASQAPRFLQPTYPCPSISHKHTFVRHLPSCFRTSQAPPHASPLFLSSLPAYPLRSSGLQDISLVNYSYGALVINEARYNHQPHTTSLPSQPLHIENCRTSPYQSSTRPAPSTHTHRLISSSLPVCYRSNKKIGVWLLKGLQVRQSSSKYAHICSISPHHVFNADPSTLS